MFYGYFERAANQFQTLNDDQATFDVLEASEWRKGCPRPKSLADEISDDETVENEQEAGDGSDDENWDPCKDGNVDEDDSDSSHEIDPADFDVGGRFPVDW